MPGLADKSISIHTDQPLCEKNLIYFYRSGSHGGVSLDRTRISADPYLTSQQNRGIVDADCTFPHFSNTPIFQQARAGPLASTHAGRTDLEFRLLVALHRSV